MQVRKKKHTEDVTPSAFRPNADNSTNDKASTNPEETSPGPDTPNPDSDIEMDNEKEKSAQKPEEKNLDLVMENDDWAASPASSLSPYEENESFDSANRWD